MCSWFTGGKMPSHWQNFWQCNFFWQTFNFSLHRGRKNYLFQLCVVTTFIYSRLRHCLHYSSNAIHENCLKYAAKCSFWKGRSSEVSLILNVLGESYVLQTASSFLIKNRVFVMTHCLAIHIPGHRRHQRGDCHTLYSGSY